MNNFIYSQQESQSPDTSKGDAYYTISGREDFLDQEDNPRSKKEDTETVMAKKLLRVDGTYRYMIKLDRTGKIYNPLSIYGQNQATSFLDRVCRSQNKFKDVNQKAFSMYMNFLKTKNAAWLHNTEREI